MAQKFFEIIPAETRIDFKGKFNKLFIFSAGISTWTWKPMPVLGSGQNRGTM